MDQSVNVHSAVNPKHTVAIALLVGEYTSSNHGNGVHWSRNQPPNMGYMELCYDVKTHVGLDIILWNLNLMKVFSINNKKVRVSLSCWEGKSKGVEFPIEIVGVYALLQLVGLPIF